MPVHVPVHEHPEDIPVVCSQQINLSSQCVVCIGISGQSTAYISVPSHAPIWTVARSVVGAAIHHLCEIRVDGHAVTFSSPAHRFRDRVVRCFLHGLPGGAGKNNQLKSRIVQLLLDSQHPTKQIAKTVDLIHGKVPEDLLQQIVQSPGSDPYEQLMRVADQHGVKGIRKEAKAKAKPKSKSRPGPLRCEDFIVAPGHFADQLGNPVPVVKEIASGVTGVLSLPL